MSLQLAAVANRKAVGDAKGSGNIKSVRAVVDGLRAEDAQIMKARRGVQPVGGGDRKREGDRLHLTNLRRDDEARGLAVKGVLKGLSAKNEGNGGVAAVARAEELLEQIVGEGELWEPRVRLVLVNVQLAAAGRHLARRNRALTPANILRHLRLKLAALRGGGLPALSSGVLTASRDSVGSGGVNSRGLIVVVAVVAAAGRLGGAVGRSVALGPAFFNLRALLELLLVVGELLTHQNLLLLAGREDEVLVALAGVGEDEVLNVSDDALPAGGVVGGPEVVGAALNGRVGL